MRLIDEIELLRKKIDRIDTLSRESRLAPAEVDIIETAFWARSILDTIEQVDLGEYQHSIKTNLRTTHSISDPGHPESAKAVYEHNKNISLKKLLGTIIHFHYFAFTPHADGNHCLDVQSDQNKRYNVYYSDFIMALRSLVISKRLVALTVCDFVERDFARMDNLSEGPDELIFSHINFFWLLHELFKDETELKIKIMERIFGIAHVPAEALTNLSFFQSRLGPGEKMVIGFGPGWENDQDVFSPPFDRPLLFNMIRRFYARS